MVSRDGKNYNERIQVDAGRRLETSQVREASTGKDAGDTIYDFQRVGTWTLLSVFNGGKKFIDCWQSAFSLKIHRFLIPATAFARARWRVMSFFKTLKLGRLIANQIREFCPKTVTLLIRRLPPKFFMCGLGKLCPSVYLVKTGQFSDLFRKPVKNICVFYPSHFFCRIWWWTACQRRNPAFWVNRLEMLPGQRN